MAVVSFIKSKLKAGLRRGTDGHRGSTRKHEEEREIEIYDATRKRDTSALSLDIVRLFLDIAYSLGMRNGKSWMITFVFAGLGRERKG